MNFKIFILLCCSLLLVKCNYDEDEKVLLESTTMRNFTKTCRNDTLVVLGHVLKLSDLIDENSNKLKDICTKRKITKVNIFSSYTLYLDRHLMAKCDGLSLAIIAPRWVVIGPNVTINLQGCDGPIPKNFDVNSYDKRPEERDIYSSPGGPGGTFYGIGEQFVNAENLTIDVSGGKGGDAGTGVFRFARYDIPDENSKNGEFISIREDLWEPTKNKALLSRHTYRDVWNYSPFETAMMLGHVCKDNTIRLPDANGPVYRCQGFGIGIFVVYNMTHISRDYGCTPGEGGYPGMLEMYALNGEPHISMLAEQGKRLKQRTNESFISFELYNPLFPGYVLFSIYNDRRVYRFKILEPEPAPVVTRKTKLQIINEAKKFFRTRLTNRYENVTLIRFLTLMDENRDIINLYDVETMIQDLDNLDEEVYHLNIDKLTLYKSLLLRVERYLLGSTKYRKFIEDKNILVYLASSIYTRVYFLEKIASPILITNMQLYLENLLKALRRIEKMERKHNIIRTVSEALSGIEGFKQNFNDEIYQKINETEKLISETVQPEIENSRKQFGEDIKNLVSEVAEIKRKNEVLNIIELYPKKQSLRWKVLGRGFLRVLSGLAPYLIVLTKISDPFLIAGAGIISSIAQKYLSDDGGSLNGYVNQIQSDMKSQYKTAKTISTALEAEERAKFYDAIKKLHKDSKISKSVEEVLNYASGRMAQARNLQEVASVIAETSAVLTPIQGMKNVQDIAGVFFTMADEAKRIINLVTDFQKDHKQLSIIQEAIKKNEKNFKMLEEYEQKINSVITPTLTKMMEDIKIDTFFTDDNQFQMKNLLKKWQISKALDKVKDLIVEMMKRFNVQSSIYEHIESFMHSINNLISMYSSIENYQRDQRLADYVAEVVETSTDLITQDDKFKNQRFKLDRKISDALIWKQYQTTVEALKQFTFPFAKLYFQGMYHVSRQPLKNDIQYLATFVADRVDSLLFRLE